MWLNILKNFQKNLEKETDIAVGFDVTSLFTNVPLKETIFIIADYLYGNNAKVPPSPPFNKAVFFELLQIAADGMFLYKGR